MRLALTLCFFVWVVEALVGNARIHLKSSELLATVRHKLIKHPLSHGFFSKYPTPPLGSPLTAERFVVVIGVVKQPEVASQVCSKQTIAQCAHSVGLSICGEGSGYYCLATLWGWQGGGARLGHWPAPVYPPLTTSESFPQEKIETEEQV